MAEYHEPPEELKPEDRDYVRALTSVKEELEAVTWYHQRVATCSDEQLKKLLTHNRNEEMEHAVMLLEWLRRSMPGWDEQMSRYLFTSGDLTEIEESEETEESARQDVNSPDLGIGSQKNR